MENKFSYVERITVMLRDRTLISKTFLDEYGEFTTIKNKDYIVEILIRDPETGELRII